MAVRHGARSILIIDDDEDFRVPVRIVLGARGYRVRCAGAGDEGVRMAAEEPPDLILLDFLMPGKNGLETSQELLSVPALAAVPVLGLSSFGEGAAAYYGRDAAQMPANILGYLEKPVEFGVLFDRVAKVLEANPRRRP